MNKVCEIPDHATDAERTRHGHRDVFSNFGRDVAPLADVPAPQATDANAQPAPPRHNRFRDSPR